MWHVWGNRKGAYWGTVEKPKGKRLLERRRRRWEDNIKIDLGEVGWGMDWMDLAQDRDRRHAVVNAVTNLPVP